MTKKILIFSNYAWTIYNFRLPLIKFLIEKGFSISILTLRDEYFEKLKKIKDVKCYPITINLIGKNPIEELKLIRDIYKNIKLINPDTVLTFTIKPNLYTGLVNSILKKKLIGNITGIGEIEKNYFYPIIKIFYKFSLSNMNKIFFQNNDDMQDFIDNHIVEQEKADRINGTGVNLEDFKPVPKYVNYQKKIFLMAGRLLPDKGYYEFIEVAKKMKDRSKVEFHILGKMEKERKSSVILYDYILRSDSVRYQGFTDSIKKFLINAYFIVLPSYYNEGVPRILIESLAMGKPVITTDFKGCKDAVINEINGFLVKQRDVNSLQEAIEKALQLTETEYQKFCEKSRKLAEEKFNEKFIFQKYLSVILN